MVTLSRSRVPPPVRQRLLRGRSPPTADGANALGNNTNARRSHSDAKSRDRPHNHGGKTGKSGPLAGQHIPGSIQQQPENAAVAETGMLPHEAELCKHDTRILRNLRKDGAPRAGRPCSRCVGRVYALKTQPDPKRRGCLQYTVVRLGVHEHQVCEWVDAPSPPERPKAPRKKRKRDMEEVGDIPELEERDPRPDDGTGEPQRGLPTPDASPGP